MFKEIKVKSINELYTFIKGIADSIAHLNKLCGQKLFDLVEMCGEIGVNVDGIPHTAIDLNDEDEDGICKQKQIESLYNKKLIGGQSVVMVRFTDGTESDNVAFDDIAYLIEELGIGFVCEEIMDGE